MNLSAPFKDKVALVTGGASGIGFSCAQRFSQRGAAVVIADRDEARGREAAAQLIAGGAQASFVRLDVTDPQSAKAAVQACVQTYGKLNLAVNSAGIAAGRMPIGDHDLDIWHQVIDINLTGVFHCLRAEIPAMLAAGGGAIVNLASIFGMISAAGTAAYTASKHGVVGLTKAAAIEHAKAGVRVNAVGPGYIDTPMIHRIRDDPETRERIIGQHPIGRLGKPEEMAELILFLCSDAASFITGSYYVADGGHTAQ